MVKNETKIRQVDPDADFRYQTTCSIWYVRIDPLLYTRDTSCQGCSKKLIGFLDSELCDWQT